MITEIKAHHIANEKQTTEICHISSYTNVEANRYPIKLILHLTIGCNKTHIIVNNCNNKQILIK